MHGNAPLSPITHVPGWETEAEQRLLLELAQAVPEEGVILEIGGEFGMSASLFCKGACANVRIYTVDLFPGDLLAQHRANLAEAGFANRSEPIQGDSRRVVMGWHEDIDLLFVDGAHDYEAVLADLQNWTPFVKQGGVVILHDVACETNKLPHVLHYEVKRALDKWLDTNWTVERSVDSAIVLRRIGLFAKGTAYIPTGLTELVEPETFVLKRREPPLIDESGLVITKDNSSANFAAVQDENELHLSGDLDAEVHQTVDPEIYDEPKTAPSKRGRKKREQ